jgi:hypothetical protein
MTKATGAAGCALAALLVSGCQDFGSVGRFRLPLAPSSSAPIAPVSGEIALTSSAPAAGATIAIRDCNPTGFQGLCTEQLQVVFDVVLDHDVVDATLSVGLTDGVTGCAFGRSSPATLRAGVHTTMTVSVLQLSEGDGPFCRMPATTTRLTASVAGSVSREFAQSYTFVLP